MNRSQVRAALKALIDEATPIESLSQFDAEVKKFADAWDAPRPKLWFRGHADASWNLTPPALRDEMGPKQLNEYRYEMHMFNEFKRRGIGLVQPEPKSDWGWLYVAQHHGLPTRLLDWSEGSHIALFFAIATRPTDKFDKACVWALNPGELNNRNWGFSDIVTVEQEHPDSAVLLNPYRHGTAPEKADGKQQPILSVIPEYVTPRLRAQRGVFVAFADDYDALFNEVVKDKASNKPVCRPIVIDGDRAQEIERELDDAGVSHSTVFPDVGGLCAELARRHVMGRF